MEWIELGQPTASGSQGASSIVVAPASAPRAVASSTPRFRPAPRTLVPRTFSVRFVDALADRSVGALFWLWIEVVAGCGVVYWLLAWASPQFGLTSSSGPIASGFRGFLPALYFSAVTATSIGYGDIVPTGA